MSNYLNNKSYFKEILLDLNKVEKELIRVLKVDDPVLSQTCISLLQAGGKRMRPGFTLLAGKFFDYSFEKLLPIAVALEIIHMATLVHDDVVDASLTRRGKPTLVASWGNEISVATGDYLLAKALEQIIKIDDKNLSAIIAKVCVDMCQGEIYQIKYSYDVKQNFKQYLYRINRKTALLFSLCCKLGAMACNADKRGIWIMKTYGHCLGIAFQIVDDILDITADPKILGKPVGSDVRQGIITLPMIFALQDPNIAERLSKLLALDRKTEEQVQEAVDLIKQSDGIAKSNDIVQKYIKKGIKNLSELPDIPAKDALIELAEFVGKRTY